VVSAHELILLRHADALPAAIDAEDFSRALTSQGRAAAARAARKLAGGAAIERVLYSPALRTSETAAIVATELALGAALLEPVPELYLATPLRIRAAIAQRHGGARTLLVVGHNPSLSELGGELDPLHKQGHLATAAFWRLPLATDAWRELTQA
jgi:phosphohistidine phosphatase SixA